MGIRHLLVHMDSSGEVEERLGLAIALARKFGAKLAGLFAEADVSGTAVAARRSPQRLEEAASKAREVFDTKVSAAGIDAEWWPLGGAAYADLIDTTAACCRYVDLAIFGQHDEKRSLLPPDFIEQVLLECGRPLLVVPLVGHYADIGKRVVIGWNSSRESARALGDALPLMEGAEFVQVLAFRHALTDAGPTIPANIVSHLALHGFAARYQWLEQTKDGIGPVDSLLNYGFESGADLIVLGARVEGFPTRHLAATSRESLHAMVSPVLVSA